MDTSMRSDLVRSFMYWMVPGGSVSRVKVLFTAMVIRHTLPLVCRSTPLMSASNGRWPPTCSVTLTPFTHCERHGHTTDPETVTNHESKTTFCIPQTYKHWVIVSASHSKHDPRPLVLDPARRHPYVLLIPHPANEITDFGVLCDVIVAGRHRHVNNRPRLE